MENELAQRRFAAELEASRIAGHCMTAVGVLAGAHRDAAYHPLVDAVLPTPIPTSISGSSS